MIDVAEYKVPIQCEMCLSQNLITRVLYDKGITRYVCLNCGYSRSIAKETNLQKRHNTSLNHWAESIKSHHPSCYICGTSKDLEAHHIIPVSHSEKHKYSPSNGITLCKQCHYLVHNKEITND